MYDALKFIHVLGVVVLLGNITATSLWKVFADRTGEPSTMAFAQHMVVYTDWALTCGGVVLLMIGGYGMAGLGHFPLADAGWLMWGQICFAVSGGVWLAVLVPIQRAQARMARRFAIDSVIPDGYVRLTRRWLLWGVAATVPLVGAVYLMIIK